MIPRVPASLEMEHTLSGCFEGFSAFVVHTLRLKGLRSLTPNELFATAWNVKLAQGYISTSQSFLSCVTVQPSVYSSVRLI